LYLLCNGDVDADGLLKGGDFSSLANHNVKVVSEFFSSLSKKMSDEHNHEMDHSKLDSKSLSVTKTDGSMKEFIAVSERFSEDLRVKHVQKISIAKKNLHVKDLSGAKIRFDCDGPEVLLEILK
jgi:hypothetical protein